MDNNTDNPNNQNQSGNARRLYDSNKIWRSSCVVAYNFLMFMLIWSLVVTMNMHPGQIPLYWGFYIGDEDYKRKRYCLICNAFKPERSHHCSVCNVCVLNMDHHCPWVNNCIGFYNRKYFMQLLFYLCLITWFVNIALFSDIYVIAMKIYTERMNTKDLPRSTIILVAYCITATLSVLIFFFFKFHVNLVLVNTTTIESLDKQNIEQNRRFRLTTYENWIQVFGEKKILWFFPLVLEEGRPSGDGLNWKTTSFIEGLDNPAMQAIHRNNNSGGNSNSNGGFNSNNTNSQPVQHDRESELQRNPFFSTNLKNLKNQSNVTSLKSPNNFKQNYDSNVFSTNPFSPGGHQQPTQNNYNSNNGENFNSNNPLHNNNSTFNYGKHPVNNKGNTTNDQLVQNNLAKKDQI